MIFIHLVLLSGGVYFFFTKSKVENKILFWLAWLFRVVMGIALGLVYTYYYGANDTWHFFEDAKTLSALARTDLGEYLQFLFSSNPEHAIWQTLVYTQERSLFLAKIISVFAWISDDNYWTCALYFATISFLAAWTLYVTVVKHFEETKLAAGLAFLFFPSVVFWSSGLVKETLALAGIFWITVILIKFLKGESVNVRQLLIGIVAFWVAWNLKYYWAALFVVVVTTTVLTFLLQKFKLVKSYWGLTWGFLFFLICVLVSQVHPNFYFSRFLEVIVSNHDAFVQISKPEGLIHFYNLDAVWWSIIVNFPWALVSGLFRPWLGEASGFTGLMAAFENLFLLALLLGNFLRKSWRTHYGLLLTAILVYVTFLCVLLALSTPNLGTLSRYRVGFLPFFVFVIAYGNPLIEKIRQSTWHRHK